MKILYVVKTNEGAGWAYRHVEWILSHSDQFDFVILMPSKDGGFADKYKAIGCEVIQFDCSLPIKKPWKYWSKKKEIQKLVQQIRPDIIHSHFVTTTFMLRLALKKNNVKIIFQVPGPLHLESAFFRTVDKITMRKNDYLVGACEWTCNAYRKMGVPEDKVFLDYYGGTPYIPDDTLTILHDEYKLDDNIPLVGMVSYFYAPKRYLFQFRGIKGHEDLIDAMSIVRKQIPNAKAIIIGSAWGKKAVKYEKKVQSYAEKKCPNGIIFTGRRNDVPDIYHEFNVAVHPSWSENVGGAGESLGLAVPTVSTNVGGFPDVVINGITGWTVEKKSPKQLAEKIIWMLNNQDEAKKMALAGKNICNEKFIIDVTAGKMVQIYHQIFEHNKETR